MENTTDKISTGYILKKKSMLCLAHLRFQYCLKARWSNFSSNAARKVSNTLHIILTVSISTCIKFRMGVAGRFEIYIFHIGLHFIHRVLKMATLGIRLILNDRVSFIPFCTYRDFVVLAIRIALQPATVL